MKLEYTGPKEIISPHGINFKNGKDDKYVYIYPAMQIYNAIHHNYEKGIIYTHNIEGKRLNNQELLNEILSFKDNFQEHCKNKISKFKLFLEEEINNAKNHTEYTKEEQQVYKNNLIIMKNYRIQRETNKIIYNHLIETIVDDIFTHKLKELNTPFNERFWHTLQSIQGELSNHEKRSIGSQLDTIHNETITISLKINSIGK